MSDWKPIPPATEFLPGPVAREDVDHCNFLVRKTDGLPMTMKDPRHLERQCAGERGHGPWGSWCPAHAEYMEALRKKAQH